MEAHSWAKSIPLTGYQSSELFCRSLIWKPQVPCLNCASSVWRLHSCASPCSWFLRFHVGLQETSVPFLSAGGSTGPWVHTLSSVHLCLVWLMVSLMSARLTGDGLVHHAGTVSPVERSHMLKTCSWNICETPSVYFVKQEITGNHLVDSTGPSSSPHVC